MHRARTSVELHDDAKRIAKELVENHIAVSVHIREIESVYSWEGQVKDKTEYEVEALVHNTEKFKQYIANTHPYILPEIILDKVKTTPMIREWCNSWCDNE